MRLRRTALAAALFALPFAAHAFPITYIGAEVQIDYDPDTFSFAGASDFGDFGGPMSMPLAPGDFTVTTTDNRAEIRFNGTLSATDSATGESDPLFQAVGTYSAAFAFMAQPGYLITGYRIRTTGTYDIEVPGEVGGTLGSVPGGFFAASGSAGFGTPFSTTLLIAGATAPSLTGDFFAFANVTQVQTGTVDDPTRPIFGDFVPDDPLCTDEFTCSGTRPIIGYEQLPVFQTDLGSASINIETLSIEAVTRPVPEPQTWAMLAAGLGVAGAAARRRRR
ncbi:MAG: PEPxxWA-CTERM sorting domain-containing protein [Burkholderiales bacterium]|nr:PEPxxWA-CTERM sorting domain-containing protein [Burkholderiales bacterium]